MDRLNRNEIEKCRIREQAERQVGEVRAQLEDINRIHRALYAPTHIHPYEVIPERLLFDPPKRPNMTHLLTQINRLKEEAVSNENIKTENRFVKEENSRLREAHEQMMREHRLRAANWVEEAEKQRALLSEKEEAIKIEKNKRRLLEGRCTDLIYENASLYEESDEKSATIESLKARLKDLMSANQMVGR